MTGTQFEFHSFVGLRNEFIGHFIIYQIRTRKLFSVSCKFFLEFRNGIHSEFFGFGYFQFEIGEQYEILIQCLTTNTGFFLILAENRFKFGFMDGFFIDPHKHGVGLCACRYCKQNCKKNSENVTCFHGVAIVNDH